MDSLTGSKTEAYLKSTGSCAQVTDAMLLLASPYPASGSVVVVNQTSQLVDASLRPVPLSEVYGELHIISTTSSDLCG